MSTTPPPPGSPARHLSEERPDSPIIATQQEQVHFKSDATDQMAIDSSETININSRPLTKTPEPRVQLERANGQQMDSERSPSTPGHLPPFDWEEFEARYEKALAEANQQERELLAEFEALVKYFNVWASAASAHDNERATKRLQTRERYVKIAESSLVSKKKHLSEVVRAFQSALALLSKP